ncbi:MAG: FIST C-terminal domain-containing protein [Phycisphaeraceae bacterium]|nr:FIST C-terminal domain-containing protein [Phycisphaeraceae bacterium]
MQPERPVQPALGAWSSASGHLDTRTAAYEIAESLEDEAVGADCVFVFASYQHRAALPEAVQSMARMLRPGTLLAVTAEAVVGPDRAFERCAGMSALALRLPACTVTPWWATPEFPLPLRNPLGLRQRLHHSAEARASIFFADPFSVPIARLLPAMDEAIRADRPMSIGGAVASGASQAGNNVLIMDELVLRAGAVGATFAGDLDVDFLVSQGCRPIGAAHVVTRVRENVILELGGRPALEVMRETVERASPGDRSLVEGGMLLGHVINERKRPFGRGDFLVRSLLGADPRRGGIVVGDVPRPGQTVQFHVRDARTATEDLELLLDSQVMGEPPLAALLFTCNGRSAALFGEEGHDLAIIRRRLGNIPVAGLFAAGEVGPVGGRTCLHGHTACLVLFRGR